MENRRNHETNREEFTGTVDEFALISMAVGIARLRHPRRDYEYTRIAVAVDDVINAPGDQLALSGDDAALVISAVRGLAVDVKTYEIVSGQTSPISEGIQGLVSDIVPEVPHDSLGSDDFLEPEYGEWEG